MKVTVILIEIGAPGTVTKGLVKGLKGLEITGRVETIETTVLLRSPRIRRSPGNLTTFVVTQNPVKRHQLMLM